MGLGQYRHSFDETFMFSLWNVITIVRECLWSSYVSCKRWFRVSFWVSGTIVTIGAGAGKTRIKDHLCGLRHSTNNRFLLVEHSDIQILYFSLSKSADTTVKILLLVVLHSKHFWSESRPVYYQQNVLKLKMYKKVAHGAVMFPIIFNGLILPLH